MKVYIEEVILLNFILDYMILYGTKRLLKRKNNQYRMLMSSLIGSLTIFLLWIHINQIECIILKIFLSIIMNVIAFGKNMIIENTIYFYMLSIILGGTIELILKKTNFHTNFILLIISCPIIIRFFIKEYKKYKCYSFKPFQVKILIQKKWYEFEGFIDTGNHLKSPFSHKSIILIDQAIPHENSLYIPYKALNCEGILECMKPDKIMIDEIEIKRCLVGISKDKININGYHCILPNSIKEEL